MILGWAEAGQLLPRAGSWEPRWISSRMATPSRFRKDMDQGDFGGDTMRVFQRWGFAGLALVLAAGWSYREVAFALDQGRHVMSQTINLDQVPMRAAMDRGQPVGQNGVYLSGDTPA